MTGDIGTLLINKGKIYHKRRNADVDCGFQKVTEEDHDL